MEIEHITSRVPALEFTNEAQWRASKAIEEKYAALALLSDDLQNREYENVALQAQRDVYQTQFLDLIINRHVPRAKVPGKDNTVMIIEKNSALEKD